VIAGIGIDMVEVPRMQKILQRWGDRFTVRVYTPEEIAYCQGKAMPAIHYAARFAAKEAVLKALGLGLGMGLDLREVGVARGDVGNPRLTFSERGLRMVWERAICRTHLSLTHTRESALSMVILETQA